MNNNFIEYTLYILYSRQAKSALRYAAMILLLMVMGVTGAWGQTDINSLAEITDPTGHYRLTSDVDGSGQYTCRKHIPQGDQSSHYGMLVLCTDSFKCISEFHMGC